MENQNQNTFETFRKNRSGQSNIAENEQLLNDTIENKNSSNIESVNNNFCPLAALFKGLKKSGRRSCNSCRTKSRCKSRCKRRRRSCCKRRSRSRSSCQKRKSCSCGYAARKKRRCASVCVDKCAPECKKCENTTYRVSPYAMFVKDHGHLRCGEKWCTFVNKLAKKWKEMCPKERAKYYRKAACAKTCKKTC